MAAPEAPRTRPWRRWLLLASLGLNLVFVGLVAGVVLRGPPDGGPPGPGLWHYARALPPAHRRDLGRALRESRPEWTGPREALRSKRIAFAGALTADPFEPAAVAAILDDEVRLTGGLAERGTRLLLEQIERMTPEERAAYAEAILKDRRRGRRR
jgi:uncharacterized membrane protein